LDCIMDSVNESYMPEDKVSFVLDASHGGCTG